MSEYTPPRAILLNRAYNAITRADYTPESIQAAIETLFDATRTAALEEAAVIAENISFGSGILALENRHGARRAAVEIHKAKDGD